MRAAAHKRSTLVAILEADWAVCGVSVVPSCGRPTVSRVGVLGDHMLASRAVVAPPAAVELVVSGYFDVGCVVRDLDGGHAAKL